MQVDEPRFPECWIHLSKSRTDAMEDIYESRCPQEIAMRILVACRQVLLDVDLCPQTFITPFRMGSVHQPSQRILRWSLYLHGV